MLAPLNVACGCGALGEYGRFFGAFAISIILRSKGAMHESRNHGICIFVAIPITHSLVAVAHVGMGSDGISPKEVLSCHSKLERLSSQSYPTASAFKEIHVLHADTTTTAELSQVETHRPSPSPDGALIRGRCRRAGNLRKPPLLILQTIQIWLHCPTASPVEVEMWDQRGSWMYASPVISDQHL
ncbi:hypothetical protein BKA93DRAFT_829478 [Sparassis latifolia]